MMFNQPDNLFFNLLIIIIPSSGVAALVSGIFNIFKSRSDYRNKYFEQLVKKRMESYEMIEEFLGFFSTIIRDEVDNKYYYIIFDTNQVETRSRFVELIKHFNKSNVWISNELSNELIKFNRFIVENDIHMNSIEDGKKYYIELGYLQNDLLELFQKDIPKLYRVNKIKKKKIAKGLTKILIKSK